MAQPRAQSGKIISVRALVAQRAHASGNGAQRMLPGDFVHLEPQALHALTAEQDASLPIRRACRRDDAPQATTTLHPLHPTSPP